MPAETFHCPHCRRQLTKSPQAYIMGEAMSRKDQPFIAIGEMAQRVTCPGCLGWIDAEKMMRGEYDAQRPAGVGCTPVVVFFVVLIALAMYTTRDGPPVDVPVTLGGAIVAAIVAYVIVKRRKGA